MTAALFAGPVNVDWFGAAASGDVSAAFAQAALFPSVYVPPRTYRVDNAISILSGQQWNFDGATLTHTDDTETFFSAVDVDDWSIRGNVTLQGLLTSSSNTGEKGLHVEGCRRYRVEGITATLFKGYGIHIVPGARAASSLLADTGRWTNIHVDQSFIGLLIDAGAGAEYNTFVNLTATGNITGVQIAAGNTVISGGNIVKNATNGLVLTGGSNNGHGIISNVNINHNGSYNLDADGVTNGFTINVCHLYADSGTSGKIRFRNGTTNVALSNCIVDSPIIHDSAAANRIINSLTSLGLLSVGGTNAGGLVQAGNY